MNIKFVGDIVEENGKTIKENNLEKTHEIPIGSLVELESGERQFVCSHIRDCDGEPLYAICSGEHLATYGSYSTKRFLQNPIEEVDHELLNHNFDQLQVRIYSSWSGGHSKESLKVIK